MQRNSKIKKIYYVQALIAFIMLYYAQAIKTKKYSLKGTAARKITVDEADIMYCHFIITVECK